MPSKRSRPARITAKPMAPKAVPNGGAALHRAKENVKSLPGELARPGLQEKPAVEGPPGDRPRPARQPGNGERSVLAEGLQRVHPGLEGQVVLLQELPGKRRPGERVPSRRPHPARDDLRRIRFLKWTPSALLESSRQGAPAARSAARDLRLLEREERPHVDPLPAAPPARGDACTALGAARPPAAAPAGQAHQHRLGDVVLLVAEPENPHPPRGHPVSRRTRSARRAAAASPRGRRRAVHLPDTRGTPSAAQSALQKRASAVDSAPAQPVVEMERDQAARAVPANGPRGGEEAPPSRRRRKARPPSASRRGRASAHAHRGRVEPLAGQQRPRPARRRPASRGAALLQVASGPRRAQANDRCDFPK